MTSFMIINHGDQVGPLFMFLSVVHMPIYNIDHSIYRFLLNTEDILEVNQDGNIAATNRLASIVEVDSPVRFIH